MTFVAKKMVNLKYFKIKLLYYKQKPEILKMSLILQCKSIYNDIYFKNQEENYQLCTVEIIPQLITSFYYPVIINAY